MSSRNKTLSKSSSHMTLKRKDKDSASVRKEKGQPLSSTTSLKQDSRDPSEGGKSSYPEGSDLAVELQTRDRMIEKLNAKVISLTALAKRLGSDSISAKEKQIAQLLEEKSGLLKQLKTAEKTIGELELKLQTADETHREEKEKLESMVEVMTEETEKLKGLLSEKGTQNTAAKADVSQMSKIVQEMTDLNAEMNEKIMKLNTEMEENNKAVFEATAKSQQTEEIEKELAKEKTENQQLAADLEIFKEGLDRNEAQLRNALGVISAVSEDLKTVENEEVKKAVEALTAIPSFLPAQKSGSNPADIQANLTFKIKQLQTELKTTKRETARIGQLDSLQKSRISALETEKAKLKSDLGTVIDRLKKQLGVLREWMRTAVEKADALQDKYELAVSDLQKSEAEAFSLSDKCQSLKARLLDLKKAEDASKLTIKSLKMDLIDANADRTAFETALQAREAKAKEATSKFEALTEELWKRDNEILRCEAQRLKLQENIGNLKTAVQSSHTLFKIKMSEEMSKVNFRLEDKEMEIIELKRILTQGQSLNGALKKPTPKNAKSTIEKLEEGLRQLKTLKDRTKSGTGDESDRQIAGSLKAQGTALLSKLGTELQTVMSVILTPEEVSASPNLKEILTTRALPSITVKDALAELKRLVDEF